MRRLLVFSLWLPMLLAVCTPGVSLGATTHSVANSRVGAATDAQIEATIRTKLAKSKIGKDGFRFRVQRGVVTWEGSTNVVQHKGSATRMARAAGAVQVINNIHISGGATSGAIRHATVQ